MQKDGNIYVVTNKTSLDTLASDLSRALNVPNPQNEVVLIRADKEVKYKQFMSVVNQLQTDGYYKVGLITEDVELIAAHLLRFKKPALRKRLRLFLYSSAAGRAAPMTRRFRLRLRALG